MIKNKSIVLVLCFFFYSFQEIFAQCAMCKAQLENGDSGLEEGINDGIIYLMVIPYVLLTIIVLVVFKGRVRSGIKRFINS